MAWVAHGGRVASVSGRFDDLRHDTAWVFDSCDEVITADDLHQVHDALGRLDVATRAGAWAWGYVSYEAAPAFDPAFRVAPRAPGGPPLVCFALGPPPRREAAIALPSTDDGEDLRERWQRDWTVGNHRLHVDTIRTAIAAGQAYQVNLTTRLRREGVRDALRLYAELAHAQRGGCNAYLDLTPDRDDGHVVISASPELFFDWDGDRVITRPMKGTARRDRSNDEDERCRARLVADPKQRAENIMIVDLLRNDLSRVAVAGSVRVERLLRPEKFETVWQLVSTVRARTRIGIGLPDLFAALFPCGSVTGAPKASAMSLIADLEREPRGIYCGAVGMIAPPGAEFRARFSVPIRTAVLGRATGEAVYGTGGAVTWDSDAEQEHDELLAKAAVLDYRARRFELLETLRFEPGGGLRNLERHLARLHRSARYFDVPFDADQIGTDVEKAVAAFSYVSDARVRLLLDRAGHLRVEHEPLADDARADAPVTLALDTRPTETSRWTVHKTTFRDHYAAASARHPDADDVILVDSSGHLLEATRANVALHLDGSWITPPLSRGCLPGVERQRMIDEGRVAEADVVPADARSASALAVISSLRGWRPARLLEPVG